MNPADWPGIVGAMRAGGYYDRIMDGGADLDRVKEYLRMFAGERSPVVHQDGMNPKYPCFPGLRHTPFREAADFAQVARLEEAFAIIRSEALALGEDDELDYTVASEPASSPERQRTRDKQQAPPRSWTVYPFWHMGVNVEMVTRRCPRTSKILAALPGLCVEYPWGDAIFSVQGPRSRLRPHCSIDNLRVRCHMGIRIPQGTGIRVGSEKRTWSEGTCLLFEDAFEHEVWNFSDERRIVLIVDFWHPDLTQVEMRALTAGFAKREVRQLFLAQRVRMTNSPGMYLPFLEAHTASRESSALIREFWSA